MYNRLFAFALILTGAACAWAEEIRVPEATRREWEEILDFGIDTQLIEVVKKIRESGDASFNGKLQNVLARSLSPALRKEILDYYTVVAYRGAEEAALVILANYENEETDLLRSLIYYLAEIKSQKSLDVMVKLVDAEEGPLAYSAISALGRLGDQSRAGFLLGKLRDAETKADRKPTIIIALGDLGAREALPELMKIVENREEDHIWRMYACEALGKIGDTAAVPAVKRVMAENDPLLKAYAASALARFDLSLVLDVLIESLKDAYWKVRVAACQGLARPGAERAVEILIFKVNKDPEAPVRVEALNALGAIGGNRSFAFLREFLNDRGRTGPLREQAFTLLLEKNPTPETVEAFERVVKQEWKSRERLLQNMAQKIMNAPQPQVKPLIALFLDHPDTAIKIYAIRGAARHRFHDLRGKLMEIEKNDPLEQVRKEAGAALQGW